MAVPIAEPSSRQERALQTRRRILEAAVELFSLRGYESVAAGDIAERAGVAHGLIFHHFGNKRGLYLEAVREISDRLFGLPPEIPPNASPGAALRAVLRQHFLRTAEHKAVVLGFMRGSLGIANDSEAWEALERIRLGMVAWLCDLLGLEEESEALRLTIRTAGDALDGITVRWLEHDCDLPVDNLVEAMVQFVVGALHAACSLDSKLDVSQAIAQVTSRPKRRS